MTMSHILETATLTVTPEAIRAYAELTDDFNPIHLDPQFAASTAMGGVIAHGTMSVCLLWQALFRSFGPDAFAALELDIRFVKPVRIGETLTAGGESQETGTFRVWVRGDDGADRLNGTVRLCGARPDTSNPEAA